MFLVHVDANLEVDRGSSGDHSELLNDDRENEGHIRDLLSSESRNLTRAVFVPLSNHALHHRLSTVGITDGPCDTVALGPEGWSDSLLQ